MKSTMRTVGGLAGSCLCGLLGVIGSGRPALADVVIEHSEDKRSYDCANGAAVVNGGNNVLTLRNCTSVTVNGGDNLVDAGTAGVITVVGSGNRVNWTPVRGRLKPKVVNLGTLNVIAGTGEPEGGEAALGSGGEGNAGGATADGRDATPGEATPGAGGAESEDAVVLMESDRRDTLDCKGGTASVVGNDNVLTLRGCRELSVRGDGNKIDAGEILAIHVFGRDNEVTWADRAPLKEPAVSAVGKGNVVKKQR